LCQYFISIYFCLFAAKYGSNNTRFEELMGLIPAIRVIGMEHALVTRGVILGPDRPDRFCSDVDSRSKSLYHAMSYTESQESDLDNLLGLDMAACL
jgi:hypothetical protein